MSVGITKSTCIEKRLFLHLFRTITHCMSSVLDPGLRITRSAALSLSQSELDTKLHLPAPAKMSAAVSWLSLGTSICALNASKSARSHSSSRLLGRGKTSMSDCDWLPEQQTEIWTWGTGFGWLHRMTKHKKSGVRIPMHSTFMQIKWKLHERLHTFNYLSISKTFIPTDAWIEWIIRRSTVEKH